MCDAPPAIKAYFPRGRITMPIEQKVTLDEVVEVLGGEVRKAVDKYFDFLQKTISSYPLGDTELGGKAKGCAEKNISMARDYMHKLSRAKNFLEVVPIHTEYMQSQLSFMGSKLRALARFIPKRRQRCSTLLYRRTPFYNSLLR